MTRLGWCILSLALLATPLTSSMVRGQDGTAPTNSTTSSTNVAATTTRTVTAKKGQTLQTIAKIVNVALEILARANPQIRNAGGVLLPGDLIIVPPYGTPPFVTPPFDPYPPYPVATTEPTSPTTPVEDEPVLAPTNEQPVPPTKQQPVPPTKQQPVPPTKQAPVTKAPTKNGPTTIKKEAPLPPPQNGVQTTRRAATTATAEEREVMARIVKGETPPTLSRDGQVAIAAVILNRVKSGNTREYGSGIIGVCHKPMHFSCYNLDYRAKLYDGPIPQRAFDAVDAALAGENPIGTATHYFNPYFADPAWKHRLVFVKSIGEGKAHRHDFYRYKDK